MSSSDAPTKRQFRSAFDDGRVRRRAAKASPTRPENHRHRRADRADDEHDDPDRMQIQPLPSHTCTATASTAPTAKKSGPLRLRSRAAPSLINLRLDPRRGERKSFSGTNDVGGSSDTPNLRASRHRTISRMSRFGVKNARNCSPQGEIAVRERHVTVRSASRVGGRSAS